MENLRLPEYDGPARRILSFAPQALRSVNDGDPASEVARGGTAFGVLRTKCARRRLTRPRKRYPIAVDGPTQYGLPSFHVRADAASSVPASGRSSGSGIASRHRLQ